MSSGSRGKINYGEAIKALMNSPASDKPKAAYIPSLSLEIRYTGNICGDMQNVPRLATLIKQERAANPEMLLLDTGGFSGPQRLGPHKGLPQVEVMNHLAYTACVPGRAECVETAALKNMAHLAKFPLLASNWRGSLEGDAYERRLVIKRREGDIVILGMAWHETPQSTELIDPLKAMDEALEGIDTDTAAIIILSQLDDSINRSILGHGKYTKILLEGLSYPGFSETSNFNGSLLVPASPDAKNLGSLSLSLSGALKVGKEKE